MTTKHSQPAIVVTGLRKSFRDHVVLNGIDLAVPQGTVFSLLGAMVPSVSTMRNVACSRWRCQYSLHP